MANVPRRPSRFLVLAASRRDASLNMQMGVLATRSIEAHGGVAELVSIRDFDPPSFDAEVESDVGLPPAAESFRERLDANDAFVIASPEYNSSMPGVLKNLIDWVSRSRPQPFNEKYGLLMSASPSMVGGNRGLWALRIPLEHLGARVYPDMFSLAQAHRALDESGRIQDEILQQRFDTNISNFMDQVEAATNYPCVKRAWVEYLGEQPDPATDRVEVA
jgi:chromate reductase, NAD(P)H dehydrogenase (quinone)